MKKPLKIAGTIAGLALGGTFLLGSVAGHSAAAPAAQASPTSTEAPCEGSDFYWVQYTVVMEPFYDATHAFAQTHDMTAVAEGAQNAEYRWAQISHVPPALVPLDTQARLTVDAFTDYQRYTPEALSQSLADLHDAEVAGLAACPPPAS